MTAPRLLPDEPLPPYSYVVGHFPHPISDPAGHSFGQRAESVAAPDPQRWTECRPYLRGLDLFNCGYYWEAHEAWESVWHACGRHGPRADFFKALIKLAAAGVKIREGRPKGVKNHAQRAAELFAGVLKEAQGGRYFGLDVAMLCRHAEELAADPPEEFGLELLVIDQP